MLWSGGDADIRNKCMLTRLRVRSLRTCTLVALNSVDSGGSPMACARHPSREKTGIVGGWVEMDRRAARDSSGNRIPSPPHRYGWLCKWGSARRCSPP